MTKCFWNKFIHSKLFIWMACIWAIFVSFPPYYVKYSYNAYSVGRCFLLGDHYAHASTGSDWYKNMWVNGDPSGKKCQVDSSRFIFDAIALITLSFISIAIYYKKVSVPDEFERKRYEKMLRKDLEILVKKIASAKSVEWDKVEYNEDESIDAYHGVQYLICSDSSIYSIFSETLNSKEKYRFFHFFSGARESALFAGRIRSFNAKIKYIKSEYLFLFRSAFKKNVVFYLSLIILYALVGIIIYSLVENPIYRVMTVLLIFLGYFFRLFAKFSVLSTEQKELIIRKINEKEISEVRKSLEAYFKEKGWLNSQPSKKK